MNILCSDVEFAGLEIKFLDRQNASTLSSVICYRYRIWSCICPVRCCHDDISMNRSNDFDKTDRKYSLSPTDVIIRFWRSKVKGHGHCRPKYVVANASTSTLRRRGLFSSFTNKLIDWLIETVSAAYATQYEHKGLRSITGYGISITRGAAAGMSFTFSLLLLTMCRNIFTRLRETVLNLYIPFDSHVEFHKIVAYTALMFTSTSGGCSQVV